MKSDFASFLEQNNTILQEYTLLIVCNVKSETNTKHNYADFDVATEYLSDTEFEQILSMFGKCHLKDFEIFNNELSFIEYILKHQNGLGNEKIIIYSSAQSGTGAGRKSLVPAFCNLNNLLYTGSNPYVVSLCRQKYHVNKLLLSAGIPVPTTFLYNKEWLFDQKPVQHQEIILKPIYESASIGIDTNSLQYYTDELDEEIKMRNIKMRQPIIAQQFIEGYEVEFPVFITSKEIYPLLPVGLSLSSTEAKMGKSFLNYEDIYFDRYYFYNFEQNEFYNNEMVDIVKKTVRLLGMHGLCRVDFRVVDKGHFYITDVSTNPHFITHSSIYYAFNLLGLQEHNITECILLSALHGGS